MTGLPGHPAPPPALPEIEAIDALVHHWQRGIDQLVSADVTIRTRGVATGWAGPAATAATRAGDSRSHDLAAAVLNGTAAIRSLEEWSGHLAQLRAERDDLLIRIDAAGAELARLAPMPDNTFASPVLRTRAWQQHRDLCADLTSWQARVSKAESGVIDALAAPDPVDALENDSAPRHQAAAESTRRALAEAAAARIPAYLLSYEPDAFGGDGEVVIAFGDPVAASHTGVVVPGITNDAATIDVQSLGALSIEAAATARSTRACTIAWMGYDAPSHPALHGGRLDPRELRDLLRTTGEGAAEDGGHELVDFVAETRAANPHTDVTVIGHSYGSTTAAHAAIDGLTADRLVLLGSPGLGDGVDRSPTSACRLVPSSSARLIGTPSPGSAGRTASRDARSRHTESGWATTPRRQTSVPAASAGRAVRASTSTPSISWCSTTTPTSRRTARSPTTSRRWSSASNRPPSPDAPPRATHSSASGLSTK
jgi:pimeloyl-ACP methyl ester carboxylesterase